MSVFFALSNESMRSTVLINQIVSRDGAAGQMCLTSSIQSVTQIRETAAISTLQILYSDTCNVPTQIQSAEA